MSKSRHTKIPDTDVIDHIDIYLSDSTGAKGVSHRVDFVDGHIDMDTLQKTQITKESILSRILGYNLCKDEIGHKYMKYELYNSRIILVAYGKQHPIDKPLGFIFAHPKDDKKGVYLSIICAIAVGKHLLNAFFLTSEHVFKYEYIELNALPSVLSYYPQFMFEHKSSCDSTPDVSMPDDLKRKIKSKVIDPDTIIKNISDVMKEQYANIEQVINDANMNNENSNTTSKKIVKLKKAYKKYFDDTYGDNEFLDYIQQLRDEGYVEEDTKYTTDSGDDELCIDADDLDIYDFIGKGCTVNGFTMIKCFKKRQSPPKTRKQRKNRKSRKSRKSN